MDEKYFDDRIEILEEEIKEDLERWILEQELVDDIQHWFKYVMFTMSRLNDEIEQLKSRLGRG